MGPLPLQYPAEGPFVGISPNKKLKMTVLNSDNEIEIAPLGGNLPNSNESVSVQEASSPNCAILGALCGCQEQCAALGCCGVILFHIAKRCGCSKCCGYCDKVKQRSEARMSAAASRRSRIISTDRVNPVLGLTLFAIKDLFQFYVCIFIICLRFQIDARQVMNETFGEDADRILRRFQTMTDSEKFALRERIFNPDLPSTSGMVSE